MKRKYREYIVSGAIYEECFSTYREALKEYSKCETATLYGITYNDECLVILSK